MCSDFLLILFRYDDLIVGAPLYYEKARAGGAIYVYMGSSSGVGNKAMQYYNIVHMFYPSFWKNSFKIIFIQPIFMQLQKIFLVV